MIKIVVDHDGFATSRPAALVRLDLDCRTDRRTEAFGVVGSQLFAHVIVKTAVPIRVAAETGNRNCTFPVCLPLSVCFDKFFLDTSPAASRGFEIFLRQITLANATHQSIDKHCRSGRLEVILLTSAEVDDVPPNAGLGVLIFCDRGGLAVEDRNQFGTSRVTGGKMLERIDQSHGIPPHRPAPDVRRHSGFLISPFLLL